MIDIPQFLSLDVFLDCIICRQHVYVYELPVVAEDQGTQLQNRFVIAPVNAEILLAFNISLLAEQNVLLTPNGKQLHRAFSKALEYIGIPLNEFV